MPINNTPSGLVTSNPLPRTQARPPLKYLVSNTRVNFSTELALYTPALVHLTIPLTFDPFAAYCEESNKDLERTAFEFSQPLFTGLVTPEGDRAWNYALFGLPKEEFELYRAWMGSVACWDSVRGVLWRIRTQDMLVRNPTSVNGTLPVCAFVTESTRGAVYFTGLHDVLPYPTFDTQAVFEDTRRFAAALRAGSHDPYAGAKLTVPS